MKYISNDGKVFNTEQECCKYEQQMKCEKMKRKTLEIQRQVRLNVINKKYKELQVLISEFEKDYNVEVKLNKYTMPFAELIHMLI